MSARRKGLLGNEIATSTMLQCETGHFSPMNAPHSPSLLSQVPLAPGDPILGVTEQYVADANAKKVNLGVGVYTDDNGKVPLLECVRRAEAERAKSGAPWSYLPIDGLKAYDA